MEQAFNAWTVTDPATGVSGTFSFTPDLRTPVVNSSVPVAGGSLGLGAEIDLFALNFGFAGTNGSASFSTVPGPVTLTSGTTGYPGTAISGADIFMNSNPGGFYTLDVFRRLLTHEIGHTIGLGDVEFGFGQFIDDNLDLSSSAAALATLTNSWTLLVDPLNPAASPLQRFMLTVGDPGTQTFGVDILMESRGLGHWADQPGGEPFPIDE